MRITVGLSELVGCGLAGGMVVALFAVAQIDNAKIPGLIAIILGIAAATVFIRAGQRRVSREICLAVGIAGLDKRVTQIARARGIR